MIEILSQDFFKILKLVVTYVQDNLLCFLVNFACLRLLHTVWQILTQFIFFFFVFFFLRGNRNLWPVYLFCWLVNFLFTQQIKKGN